jgi:heme exporter protein A
MRLSGADLVCVRGGREVFSGLSFAVEAGAALVIRGRNGAGKTSLLRMVAGLVRLASGRIGLDGGDPERTVPEQAHYLGHLDPAKQALTVGENLDFWMRYMGGAGPRAALAAAGLGALDDLPAGYLSAGQRRRLSIARLVAVPRPVWLLDEPTSSLDADGQAWLSGVMGDHLARGGIILAAAHGPIGLDGARELWLGAHA